MRDRDAAALMRGAAADLGLSLGETGALTGF